MERRRYRRARETSGDDGGTVDEDIEAALKWDESLASVADDDDLRALAKANPGVFAPNVWPSHMPQLRPAFLDVAKLVRDVGLLVAKCAGAYVHSRCEGYEPGKLESILRHSKCCKARLLHYFPANDAGKGGSENNDGNNAIQFIIWAKEYSIEECYLPGMSLKTSQADHRLTHTFGHSDQQ